MKKLYLSAGLAVLTMAGTAQVQRMVLTEAFSNASCGPCAQQNPTYNALVAANPTKVISVKYQTNWPGTDPMNAQTQSEVGPRVTYYGVTGVPWGAVDGTAIDATGCGYSGAVGCIDQAEVDAAYAIPAPFSINVTHSFNAAVDSVFIQVVITAAQNISENNLKAHVLMAERDIIFSSAPGSNGEKQFHHVMRKMYPNASGTNLTSTWNNGDAVTLTFAEAIPAYIYDLSEIEIVAFVQNNSNKDVHQVAKSNPVPVPNYAKNAFTSLNVDYSCANTVDGALNVYNNGSNAITSLTLHYKLDNGSYQTTPWTGSIAPGDTQAVTIPTISGVNAGNHSVTAYVSAINGTTNSTLNAPTAAYFVTGTAPVGTPVAEGFAVNPFPPAGWGLINFGASEGWSRQTANGYGVSGIGSARCYFYAIPGGQTRHLFAKRVDISAMNQPELKFDLAYAPYNNNYVDGLEVLVSTDCGANWTQVFFEQTGTLNTAPATTSSFSPTASQWKTETISLAPYSSSNDLLVQFKGHSGYGNNVFVDNINIGSNLTGLDPATEVNLGVFPNPAVDFANVSFISPEASEGTLVVTNMLGEVVYSSNLSNVLGNQIIQVNTTNLAAGSYLVKLVLGNSSFTEKLMVVK